MLQTRSGRCPNCKEELLPGAETCPACGHQLDWNHPANAPRAVARSASTPAPRSKGALTTRSAVEWLAYLVGAGLLIFLAIAVRNMFFSNDQTPEPDSPHAVRIQDAERFRQQILAGGAAAPEAAYVLGIAMPMGSDVLQITLKNDWQNLSYGRRFTYARNFAERWKRIHAPHRAYFILLDANGAEIGGRSLSGTVWVQEKHENARRVQPGQPTRPTPRTGSTPAQARQ